MRFKKRLYMEVNKGFKATGKSLKSLFSTVDVDQSDEIDLVEFTAMFVKMGVKDLTPQEAEHLFLSIDFDLSGKVTYPEFVADFDHFVSNDIDTLIREEREKGNSDKVPEREGAPTMDFAKGLSYGVGGGRLSKEAEMNTKIEILKAKE